MFHHTVLLRLDARFDAPARQRFDGFEAAVRRTLRGVVLYRLQPNEAPSHKGFTHALFSVFASRQDFRDYDRSALHDEIKAFLGPFVHELVVADGEVNGGAPV